MSDSVCPRCEKHTREPDPEVDPWGVFCRSCHVPIRRSKAEAVQRRVRDVRAAKMSWAEFVRWCAEYDYLAGMDFEAARWAYAQWGRHLPDEALLTDYPDFDHWLTCRVLDHPEAHCGKDIFLE